MHDCSGRTVGNRLIDLSKNSFRAKAYDFLAKNIIQVHTCVHRLYLNDKCSKSLVRTGVRKSVLTRPSVKGEAKILASYYDIKTCWSNKKQKSYFTKKMSKKSCSKLRIIHPILSGCLQYFNTDTGLLRSFNFVPAATVGTSGYIQTSYTHLANQDYKICIQVWWLTKRLILLDVWKNLKALKKL